MLAKFKTMKRAVKDTRGAAALEFALVAGPLIVMICGCIELAVIILLSVTLDNATDVAARDIRTGLTTMANTPNATAFKAKICNNMGWLSASCVDSLRVDVSTFKTFNDVKAPTAIQNGQFIPASNFSYTIGAGSEIQMVNAYYEWPMFTPFLSAGLTTLSNNDVVIRSSSVFRNEPF
ncbi:TadE/TadG family type IV pilus assembly protein [Asticcacaulis sp. 201]|uniref:TadE/TadG family type IV pilus assembly protein n=1 Tax=Asticcacaulis sp. 201 TaxID=3028787 RepID=UPI002915F6DF|nr:TadE/TadG family type IV pilus assembly protein [Asticcacaulis sp. 201]MDV6332068.1 TadE/TadG family type IV pilus assembly protein [Asticcacaulis sp. 201]